MTELSNLTRCDVASAWPKRNALIESLMGVSLRSEQQLLAYNARTDADNAVNLVPSVEYAGLGRDLQFKAIALALNQEPWLPALAKPVAYRLFSNKLNFFWHENFRVLYKDSGRVLNMFNVSLAVTDMAFAFLLGWTEEAVYQGYLTHAVLSRKHYLTLQYENEHRRAQAFMMQMFADWRGDVAHNWPAYAYDEPVYHGLLERWRDPDAASLVPWLRAACNLHTHQAARETSTYFFDFSDYILVRTPIEILMLYRLRQLLGLENPELDHPLLETPFDRLPDPQPNYAPDDLMLDTFSRVRQDWPAFDQTVSIESILAHG